MANFIIYTGILLWYNPLLFLIFAIGSGIYFGWVQIFQHFRRKFNNESFVLSTLSNNTTLQMVQGMPDIKLNGAEKKLRWSWENIQAQQFKLNFKKLNYAQVQQTGALLINQIKNIATTYFVASMVIDGRLTFGEMFAVQYIIGQVNSPIGQLVGFVQSLQDEKISMERLNELHAISDEEPIGESFIESLPKDRSISIKKLYFSYPGTSDEIVLNNVNLCIPVGKVTAIVGLSGSGKTTILRLLLKYYESCKGDIQIGGIPLKNFRTTEWRHSVGAVMQDGFIFNATIAENIALGAE